MQYNDFQLATDRENKLMSERYSSIRIQEISDLRDILSRMEEQRERLIYSNESGKYNDIISTTNENIHSIRNLLGVQSRVQSSSNVPLNDQGVYGKIPSHDEMLRMNPSSNRPNLSTDTDIPSTEPESATPPTTDLNPSTPRPRRVFPMQGSIFSNIAKSLFLGRSKEPKVNLSNTNNQNGKHSHHNEYECEYISNSNLKYWADYPHNYTPKFQSPIPREKLDMMNSRTNDCGGHPWHYCDNDCDNQSLALHHNSDWKPHHHDSHCDADRKLVTGQIDILRLLVLFIALRPKCPYVPSICKVADAQMGILIELMD